MTAVPGKNCVVSELIRAAFARDGYVVIPSLLNDDELSSMRGESHRLLKRQRLLGAQVEQNGCIAEPLDPARLSDEQRTQLNEYRSVRVESGGAAVAAFTTSDRALTIVRSLLGLAHGEGDVYIFNEQYILKPPSHSRRTEFPWHQDKEGLDWSAKEYISVWCALDDMSEENGTLYIAPGSVNSPRPPPTEEGTYVFLLLGPLILNARDCVILSSRVWHRSGANISSQWRRAYMPQYSAEPIRNPRTNTLVALALKCSDPSEHAQAAA